MTAASVDTGVMGNIGGGLVVGDGGLARALAQALSGVAGDWVVAVDAEQWRDLNRQALAGGPTLVTVHRTFGAVEIGPTVASGQTGCLECARTRARNATAAGTAAARARAHRLRAEPPVAAGALPRPAADAVASLVADELGTLAAGRLRDHLLRLHVATLTVTRHAILAHPACSSCGTLPDDNADSARIRLQPRPKGQVRGLRVRPVDAPALLDAYVDEHTGIVAGLDLSLSGEAPTCTARVAPVCTEDIKGYGRTLDRRSTVAVAILEGLERRAGLEPGGRRTLVRASFAELGPRRAVDPVLLGLPTMDPPAGTRHQRYDPGTVVNWVHGYSFSRDDTVLVPEAYAYYGVHREPLFAYECSNGCALGGSLEEAVLHGILETAERDAFLVTWYGRVPGRRVDPHTAVDVTTRLLVDRVERETGTVVHAFDITMPEGVPALWVMLVDEEDRPDRPKAFCCAAANFDPEAALRAALLECITAVGYLRYSIADADTRARALAMLHDDDQVVAMADHSLVYALAEAWPRLSFLYTDASTRSIAEAFPPADRYVPANDLTDDLRHLVDRYLGHGYDVIAVDQTTPELRRADLHCAKVIIPGMLPMTFGHRHRRAENLPRLLQAPVLLGYRSEPLSVEEVNTHPHPFP